MGGDKHWVKVSAITALLISMSVFWFGWMACGTVAIASSRSTKGVQRIEISDETGRPMTLYKGSYALLIGVSEYTNGWSDLESVPEELDRVEAMLDRQGFKVTKQLNPNKRELWSAFTDFIDAHGYNEENRLLIFYSGHGHTRKNGRKGYLVPRDAANPEKNETAFLKKALPMSQVLAWSRQMEAKHVLFLFDSCFSGTVFKAKSLPKAPPHITHATGLKVRQYLTAGSAGEPVPARSVFTPAFVDALTYGWGDLNKDGYISGTEMGLYLQEKVPQHISQTPQYGKINDYELSRGDFVFVVSAGGSGSGSGDVISGSGKENEEARKLREEREKLEREKAELARLKAEMERQQLAEERERIARERELLAARLAEEKEKEKRESRLYVSTEPSDCRIRIMNIVEKFHNGMTLDPGKYDLEVSQNGYTPWRTWVTLNAGEDLDLKVELQKEAEVLSQVPGIGDTWREPVTGMEFVWVPQGCFQMGSTNGDSDEKPVHEVCVDGFWMGKYEVTQGEWQKIMGSNPSRFKNGDRYPVERVSWNDAQAFVQKLNVRSGQRFQLPTEVEWEYAARSGGKNETYSGGNDVNRVAWYGGNSDNYTHEVGTKTPNGLGIYDMSGNVWEWCEDIYAPDAYSKHSRKNPIYASGGSDRVLRGGSWRGRPAGVRCASRGRDEPGFTNDDLGFRLSRKP